MTGTLINLATVLIGSVIGLSFRNKLPDKYKIVLLQVIGLLTIVIGIQMALKTEYILIMMAALIFGALTGQLFNIDNKIENIAEEIGPFRIARVVIGIDGDAEGRASV